VSPRTTVLLRETGGKPGVSRRILRDMPRSSVRVLSFPRNCSQVTQINPQNPQNLVIVSTLHLCSHLPARHTIFDPCPSMVLEDSGLRLSQYKRGSQSPFPGLDVKMVVISGRDCAFVSFAVARGGSLDRAISLGITLMISLLPSCILAPTLLFEVGA